MKLRALFTSFVLFTSLGASVIPQAPVFKSKVEVVQLDVSVLDKHRQPVRGLTQKDFTILEDGKPQSIVGFSAFDFDAEPPPTVGWMRDVAPDVATNDLKETRLFVLVMDDALIPQDPWMMQASKKIAMSIIEKLGPDDLTAVVFTGDNRKTQDFTSDKAKLIAALDKFNPGLAGYMFGTASEGVDVDEWFYLSSIRTLSTLADYLVAAPNRRKAVFWVSPGVPQQLEGAAASIPARVRQEKTIALFERAQRSNVTIYPIDPGGLGGMTAYLNVRIKDSELVRTKVTAMNDYIVAAAANTGGRVVMNTNDFEPGITEIFEENKSYYLLGFEPTNTAADGKLRRIQVKVNRPDVDVRTRSSYYAPEPEKPSKTKTAMTPEAIELAKAIGGLLPNGGLPLRVAIAPVAVPGQRLAAVSIVLGLRQPVPAAAAQGRVTETTELQISAFTPEGDPKGTQRHTAKVVLRAGANGDAEYEVLGRIDLPAGRYRLRLAATNATSGKTGSVFADVIVPDYSNVAFSTSPVALGATPGRVSAPKGLLASVLPFAPTADREFSESDKVESLLRLYQSGQKPIEAVKVTTTIRDDRDGIRVNETRTIAIGDFQTAAQQVDQTAVAGPTAPRGNIQSAGADKFANLALRSADLRYQLPLKTLAAGDYVLTFEATLGATTVRRDVRFRVR